LLALVFGSSLLPAQAAFKLRSPHDAAGARSAARTYNAASTLLYTESTPRDERGRIDYKDTTGARLDYDYYANGLLRDTVSSTPGGVNIAYRYDELNRLAFVDDATRGLPVRTTDYAYNANGSLSALTHANGLRHTYQYDALNRLRTLQVGVVDLNGAALATVLQSYDYRLRATGHRREVEESAPGSSLPAPRLVAFAYDPLYRLTGETISGDPMHSGSVNYTLDKVGNREARTVSGLLATHYPLPATTATYNPRDQLSTDTYDANGNTRTGSVSGTGVPPVSLAPSAPDVYDFEDRLIIRHRADLSTINLAYDADGLRIRKTLLNSSSALVSSTSYLVCTNNHTGYAQVLEERTTTATGTTFKTYTYGHDLLSVTTPSSLPATRYFLYDGGGSVRALADESGAITDRYTYDAFGVLISSPAEGSPAAAGYLYRGEQYDSDLGLYYLRARFMNPDSGRFWNQDTYEGSNSDPASLHKYLYAHANPVRYSDPTGHFVDTRSMAVSTAVMGVVTRMAIPRVARYAVAVVAGTVLALTPSDTRVSVEEIRRSGKAIIGETTIRVLYAKAHRLADAETFTWPASTEEYLTDELASGDPQERERILENANFMWINSVMARRMVIYDIGFDDDRVAGKMAFYGKPWTTENEIGKFYMMELEWTRGYALKAFMRIPGSNLASTNIK
jgi:RHS repeat-associated protein